MSAGDDSCFLAKSAIPLAMSPFLQIKSIKNSPIFSTLQYFKYARVLRCSSFFPRFLHMFSLFSSFSPCFPTPCFLIFQFVSQVFNLFPHFYPCSLGFSVVPPSLPGFPQGGVVTYLLPDEATEGTEERKRRLGGLLEATASAGMAETNGAAAAEVWWEEDG